MRRRTGRRDFATSPPYLPVAIAPGTRAVPRPILILPLLLARAAQQAAKVERGVIVGVRAVVITPNGTVGAVSGAAAGGVAGSQAPGGGLASAFGAIGGSLVGGLVGTATEQTTADTKGWEYIVQEPDGHLVSVTQTDKLALPIGLHVLVIAGKQARIVPDYTVQVAGAGKPAKPAPDLA